MTLLEIKDLRILLRRGKQEIALVDGVSLSVAPGSVVGLAGESGSGKTLTGLSALGFVPDRSRATGKVRFAGRNVLAMNQSQLRQLARPPGRRRVPGPDDVAAPMLSVGRQLTEHVEFHLGLSSGDAHNRAVELLKTVRLPDPEHVLSSFPHQFSGGMRKRIAIASTLACGPQLLIADEPTTALDVTVQAGILRLLDRLRKESDMAVLLISHDLGVMSALADTLNVMYAGRIVESGPVSGLLSAPRPMPLHRAACSTACPTRVPVAPTSASSAASRRHPIAARSAARSHPAAPTSSRAASTPSRRSNSSPPTAPPPASWIHSCVPRPRRPLVAAPKRRSATQAGLAARRSHRRTGA